MGTIAINKLWIKFIGILLVLLAWCAVAAAQPPSELDVGLVVAQFSAEIVFDEKMSALEPNGNRTIIDKGKYFAAVSAGKILLGNHTFSSGTVLEIADLSDADPDKKAVARPRNLFTVNRQSYRGQLKIYVTDDGKRLTVVNRVPMEYYVNSVLGPKSSPVWPDEAVKAQAVAVRSLAWYCKQHPQSAFFAVRAVDPEAFYGGIRNENKNITKIAAKTSGQVLYYKGMPAATYNCESSGGMTVGSEEALQRDIPYLQAVEDYDTECPEFTWEKKIQTATISRVLEQNGHKIGRLRGYRLSDSKRPDIRDRYPSGRVKLIYLQGDQGSVTMSGKEFADLLALSSTWFDAFAVDPVPDKLDVPVENGYGIEVGKKQIPIEVKGREEGAWKSAIPGFHFLNGTQDETLLFKGKGIGNGVGLSKWGAKGMADNASETLDDYYKTILQHYYPGTYLVSAY